MTLLRPLACLPLIAGLLLNPVFGASEPKEINWDDLVPAEAQFDDPFTKLDEDQLFELSLVAQIRDQLAEGQKVEDEIMANYENWIESLEEQGVDVDALIEMRDEIAKDRTAKTYLANQELEGKKVRIPGYLLPLEFDGDRVTEFFLVPYVGACIHTPPPPPNQIVHVKTDEGYTTDGGLYTPVWVSGTMQSEQSKSSLNFIDGASDIPSSYALDATSIKPYE